MKTTAPLARLASLAGAAVLFTAASPTVNALDVPRWQPHDFSFTAKSEAPNPFQIPFSATVSGPGRIVLSVPGFYDGNGTWKVRVSPTVEGPWSLVTKSDVTELDGRQAAFTCVANANPNLHGPLRVDKANPHHFVFEDGARFFLQGYEYDWLWALDMGAPGVPTVETSLDLLARHGFNYVILNSYAHDTGWRKDKAGPDDYGPPARYAWEGSNEAPDHSRMNLAFWQHYDRVMEALHQRGIQAHMLMKVYNKQVKWPARGSAEDDLFFRWLIARYAAYPNVIWDFSKEAHNEKDADYKFGRLRFLRANDPYRRLVTVHDDDKLNDSGALDELTDFRADQQHANWRAVILRQRARRAWPVVNVEFGYEHGPGGLDDKTYGTTQEPEEVVRRAWEIAMAGGYTAYYYTYTAWDVVRPLDVPLGYAYFKHFGDFWRSTEFWKLEPADALVGDGWCLAIPGREYVVFQNTAAPFTLKIAGAKSPMTAEWFNSHTGRRIAAGSFNNGVANLTPPAAWGKAPLVLHVQALR